MLTLAANNTSVKRCGGDLRTALSSFLRILRRNRARKRVLAGVLEKESGSKYWQGYTPFTTFPLFLLLFLLFFFPSPPPSATGGEKLPFFWRFLRRNRVRKRVLAGVLERRVAQNLAKATHLSQPFPSSSSFSPFFSPPLLLPHPQWVKNCRDRQLFTRCGWYNGYGHTWSHKNDNFRDRPLPVPPRGQSLAHHRLRQRGSPEKHPLPPGVIGIGQEQPDQQNSRPGNIVLHSRTQAIRRLRFGVVLSEVQGARI